MHRRTNLSVRGRQILSRRRSGTTRRRRLRAELLERRDLLAAGTNYVLIDFTPDTIDGEYQVDKFADLFDGSAVNQSNQFLNYDKTDNVVDGDDARIAAHRIASKVRQLLYTFEKDPGIDLNVYFTPGVFDTSDPGHGEQWLQRGQASSEENTYVIYVGNERPTTNVARYGTAYQAFAGKNNEFCGYAFAGGVSDLGCCTP